MPIFFLNPSKFLSSVISCGNELQRLTICQGKEQGPLHSPKYLLSHISPFQGKHCLGGTLQKEALFSLPPGELPEASPGMTS